MKEKPERALNSSRRFVNNIFPRQNLLDGIARNRQKAAKNLTQEESNNLSSQNQAGSIFLDGREHKLINYRYGELQTSNANKYEIIQP